MKDLKEKKILLIEDDPVIRLLVSKIISDLGYQVICPESYVEGFSLLIREHYSFVIIESSPVEKPSFETKWIDPLREGLNETSLLHVIIYILKSLSRIPEFIFISRNSLPEEVNFALRDGAVDFIQIPGKRNNDGIVSFPEKTNERLSNAIKRAASIADGSIFKRLNLEGMVCESWAMKRVLLQLVSVLRNDENVIISGEWGTGKSTFARTIHNNSCRKGESYVSWDIKPWKLYTTSEDIAIASGSFTTQLRLFDDLKKKSKGLIWGGWSFKRVLYELAWLTSWYTLDIYELYDDLFDNFHFTQPYFYDLLTIEPPQPYFPKNGTVYLHYIDNLDKNRLNTLARDIWRNDTKGRPFRYILSYFQDPRKLTASRFEMYTLYAQQSIHLPRLAERKEDIAGIAKLKLNAMCRNIFNSDVTMSPDFIWTLENYEWPKNIFELSNVLKYAAGIIGKDETFEVMHLPVYLQEFAAEHQRPDSDTSDSDPMNSILKKPNVTEVQLLSDDMLKQDIGDAQEQGVTDEKSSIIENPFKDSRGDNRLDPHGIKLDFYKVGKSWRIGPEGKSESFDALLGFEFLHLLLRYPERNFTPDELYQEADKNYVDFESPYVLGPSIDEYVNEINKMSEKELYGVRERLKSDETKSDDSLFESMRDDFISIAEEKIDDIHRSKTNRRTAVYNAIKRAFQHLYEKVPEMEQYLNFHTIKSGYTFSYLPVLSNTPEWTFFKNKVPPQKS